MRQHDGLVGPLRGYVVEMRLALRGREIGT